MSTRIHAAAACAVIALTMSACSMTTSSIPAPSHPMAPGTAAGPPASSAFETTQRRDSPDGEHLFYHGGPVQRVPKIYVNYWGFNARNSDPNGEQFYLTNFLEGIGGSAWLGDVTQYYEVDNGRRRHIENNVGEMQGAWIDTTPIPRSPTDVQIQRAAARLVAHFGFQRDGTYIVATAHGHNTAGFGQQFCAYHFDFAGRSGFVTYINFPYMSDAGIACGKNFINPGAGGVLDGVSIVGGSEVAEAQTDPRLGSGWIDPGGLEVGSACAWQKPPARDLGFSTGTFAVQGLWSNLRNVCSVHGP